jgi:hypothetical protein
MNAASGLALQQSSNLQSTFGEKTISDLVLMFRDGQLNLEPGFQRKSVWSWSDRRRLIQSIVSVAQYFSIRAPGKWLCNVRRD